MPDAIPWTDALPAPKSPYDFESISAEVLLRCAEKYDWSYYV